MIDLKAMGQRHIQIARLMLMSFVSVVTLSSLSYSAQHTITSLPFTITTSHNNDTLYMNGNLSAVGTAITIDDGVNGFYFRGKGDTITFNTSEGNTARGITFDDNYNFKIDSLTIIQYSAQGVDCIGMAILDGPTYNAQIYDCNVHVKGKDCKNFYHYSSTRSYNIELFGGNWTSFSDSFTNRCQNSGAAILAGYGAANGGAGDYSYWIHKITIDSCPGVAIYTDNKGLIDSNTVYVNAHTDVYDYPSGQTCWSADNSWGIVLASGDPGGRVMGNYVRVRSSYEGGRGITLGDPQGSESEPIDVSYNDVLVTQGRSDYEGATPFTHGIEIEPEDANLGINWLNIHHNTIETYVDTLASTTHVPAIGYALSIVLDIINENNHNINIYNNTVIANGDTVGNNYGDDVGRAAAFNLISDDTTNSITSYNNRYVSNSVCWSFGRAAGKSNYTISIGDTLEWNNPHYGDYLGTNESGPIVFTDGYNSLDHYFRDAVYTGDNNHPDSTADTYAGGTKIVFHQKTLRVYVYGNNDLPVPGASVWAVNNYGDSVLVGTSNSQGLVAGVVNYDYDRWVGTTHYDSVYNDFTLKAKKDNDSTIVSYTVTATSAPPVLILSNTSGEDPPEDITPPGRVDDLDAVPGNEHGEVDLSWTAPGDDENIGTATYYVIKYSTAPITEINWPSATPVLDPPAPLESGTFQTFTVDGLDEGETYYFGIKAYDEAGNGAPLSNVPNSFACGITVPLPLETVVDSANASVEVISLAVDSYLPVYYEFALDTVENFPNPRIEVDLLADSTASATFGDLSEDFSYFWRCRAVASDQSDTSNWSQMVAFNILTGVSQTLASSNCIFPLQGQAVQTNRPVFIVEYVPDIAEVYFQVDDNASFGSSVESGPVQANPDINTEWQITEPLLNGMTYYWRISSDNTIWTAPIAFSASLDIHPYPNPFRASEGHTSIIFANLPPESRLTIATVSGNIVRKVEGIGPDSWVWDVRNDNGRELASGVYLYIVEYENGYSRNKVMVIR